MNDEETAAVINELLNLLRPAMANSLESGEHDGIVLQVIVRSFDNLVEENPLPLEAHYCTDKGRPCDSKCRQVTALGLILTLMLTAAREAHFEAIRLR
jgi:hypothetical protein